MAISTEILREGEQYIGLKVEDEGVYFPPESIHPLWRDRGELINRLSQLDKRPAKVDSSIDTFR
jgi:hypothetical protein